MAPFASSVPLNDEYKRSNCGLITYPNQRYSWCVLKCLVVKVLQNLHVENNVSLPVSGCQPNYTWLGNGNALSSIPVLRYLFRLVEYKHATNYLLANALLKCPSMSSVVLVLSFHSFSSKHLINGNLQKC